MVLSWLSPPLSEIFGILYSGIEGFGVFLLGLGLYLFGRGVGPGVGAWGWGVWDLAPRMGFRVSPSTSTPGPSAS